MTQEKSPQGALTPGSQVSPDEGQQPDHTTPLGALVMALLEAQTEASKRLAALEREVVRLKRQQAESYDWSREVTA